MKERRSQRECLCVACNAEYAVSINNQTHSDSNNASNAALDHRKGIFPINIVILRSKGHMKEKGEECVQRQE